LSAHTFLNEGPGEKTNWKTQKDSGKNIKGLPREEKNPEKSNPTQKG